MSVLYLALRPLLQLVLLWARSSDFKELEMIVLRQEIRSFVAGRDGRAPSR